MSEMQAGEPVTWTVGKQVHTSTFVDGQAVSGVNVPVVLSSGETFIVFIPDDTYRTGVDAIRARIQADVDHHVAVAGLTGTA